MPIWKSRRKAMYGPLRKHLGALLRRLARQKECKCEEEEGHPLPDRVHILLSIDHS